jgi:hypothetical protein
MNPEDVTHLVYLLFLLVIMIGITSGNGGGTIVNHYACDCKDAYGYIAYQTQPPICGHCNQPMKVFHDE